MLKFPIQSGRHKGKVIDVPYYLKTYHGVELKLVHHIPATSGKSVRWVQAVHENGEIYRRCGRATYVDPLNPTGKIDELTGREICESGDNKPFYYTDKEHASRGTSFYDTPQERAPKNERLWVRFTTSLVEVTDTRIEILATLYWGYDRAAWRVGPAQGRPDRAGGAPPRQWQGGQEAHAGPQERLSRLDLPPEHLITHLFSDT